MPWIESLDWTSLNALRRYPLRQGASAQSADGLFSLPDSLIVDFSLTATSDVTRRFYIARILNRLSSIILEVRDNFTEVVGTVEIQNATHTQDQDYYLTPTSAYIGATGRFTIGKLDDLAYQPAGSFEFSLSATEFEPRTIIPGLQGVDRIDFLDSRNGSFSLTGDVKITARRRSALWRSTCRSVTRSRSTSLRSSAPPQIEGRIERYNEMSVERCALRPCDKLTRRRTRIMKIVILTLLLVIGTSDTLEIIKQTKGGGKRARLAVYC